ncbi:MAG TPA: carbohydrate ABC transporter permease [Candidatus Borkfalkia excrementigallinarum]|uniref:Carbohydrate ABC transporter permease n=1 Tax=Candidatus Borkfalkia excrementigallinarum TaxID=2838506 RepID=A0A9D2CSC9_9FIRM|nr:carbohydrate ABC transporter permease [Candidatus Borkfalkia excrementigallinarum]
MNTQAEIRREARRQVPLSQRIKHTAVQTVIYIFCTVMLLVCVLPIWLLFVDATRSTTEINQGMSLIPSGYFAMNWGTLMSKDFPLIQAFFNSIVISFSSTALSLYFSALTAYAFVAYRYRGQNVLYSIILMLMMIPGQLSMIGFYKLVVDLGLYDTYVPLIIPAIAAPGAVFFFKQYFNANFSKDIVEAARIDGANEFRIYNTMVIPSIIPAIATQAIFGIVGSWNNYMGPLMLITTTEKYTFPMIVQLLKTDRYNTDLGAMALGVFMTIVPLLVIYAIFSKVIINGVAIGGGKE